MLKSLIGGYMDDENKVPTGVPPVSSYKSAKSTDNNDADNKETDTAEQVAVSRSSAAEAVEPAPKQSMPPNKADELHGIDLESGISERKSQPQNFTPGKPRRSKKKPFIILLILVALAAIAFGVFKLLSKKDTAKPASNTSTPSEQQPTQSVETAKPKTFKSDSLKVEFTYPSDWALKEDTDKITITKSKLTYDKSSGSTKTGTFRLIIQKGINQVDKSKVDNSVAVKESLLLKYTAPATGQRTETYLSYLGKTKDAFNFFVISSGKQYAVGEKVTGTLPLGQDSYVIVGGYNTNTEQDFTFDEIALDKIDQNPAFDEAVETIKTLKIL